MTVFPPDPETLVGHLPNGVRWLVVPMPHLDSATVSVFVRTGSRLEPARLNGVSHFAEHMAFKGTASRSCQQINLDAERLGAEVNAHTDKDHTAYHMRGLARDAGPFVHMLGDIVRHSTFPEAELERERQVILQEYTEEEDDAFATAFKLFDRTCYGHHPIAQPVIGTRRTIEKLTRDDLLGYVRGQYTGANVIVAVAGRVDPGAMAQAVEAAFGDMPAGTAHEVEAPQWGGGIVSRAQAGNSQTHAVIGFPLPSLRESPAPGIVAAALFGEGMSSPLMDRIREQLGLVYYAACSADIADCCGQFVIEASTGPEHLDAFFTETQSLLAAQADAIEPVALERARNQIAVRGLHAQEKPFRRLEDAAQDLFVLGRVRSRAERQAEIEAVGAEDVRAVFERMLSTRASIAMAGKLPRAASRRVAEILASS
jgi:predicted Zn-dependent peptidase